MLKSHQAVLLFLLATALWAVVFVLQSQPSAQYQICEPNQYGKDSCTPHHLLYVVFWYGGYIFNANTITALATAAIAYFTWTIKQINDSQLRHSHQVERAYISGGGSPEVDVSDLGMHNVQTFSGSTMTVPIAPIRTPTGFFEIRVNNYGKTPGELWGVKWGFCEVNAIPASPDFLEGNFHDWIQPGVGSRPLGTVPIPKFLKQPAIYGRFTYRDIFGRWHSSGFIQSIGPGEKTRPILAPRAYTEERDEPDQSHLYQTGS